MLDVCYALENAYHIVYGKGQGFMTKIWSIILKPICIQSEGIKRSRPCTEERTFYYL